jgi:KUP system potassium uptake protein
MPLALREELEHLHAVHESVVILAVVTEPRARVPLAESVIIDDTKDILRLAVHFGYKQRVDVPACLLIARQQGLAVDLDDPVYFVSYLCLERTSAPSMQQWRKQLFMRLAKNAMDPDDYYGLPGDRVVVLGSRVGV